MKHLLIFFSACMIALPVWAQQTKTLVKGSFTAEKRDWAHFEPFGAFAGDQITIKATSTHKKRTFELYVVQYPGHQLEYVNQEIEDVEYTFEVGGDETFVIWYKARFDTPFEIEVTKTVQAQNASRSDEIVMVSIPDTTYKNSTSEIQFATIKKAIPRVEKVALKTYEMSEVILSKTTGLVPQGTDMSLLAFPPMIDDDYRESKLVSWNMTITVSDAVYQALKEQVSSGLEAVAGAALSAAKGKGIDKLTKDGKYKYVKNIDKALEIKENVEVPLEAAQEIYGMYQPKDGDTLEVQRLEGGGQVPAFVVGGGELQKVKIEQTKDQDGNAELQVEGTKKFEIPSMGDLADKAAGAITPKIKDKVIVRAYKWKSGDEEKTLMHEETTGFTTKEFLASDGNAGEEYAYFIEVENGRSKGDGKNFLTLLVFCNILLEATYEVTDYADMLYYDYVEEPVQTKAYSWGIPQYSSTALPIFKEDMKPNYREGASPQVPSI